MTKTSTTIATWFVADKEKDATYFPQVGSNSSSSTFQEVYWRCVVGFFATSIVQNPSFRHVFYTNCDPPAIGEFGVADFLSELGVEIVRIEITYRLPRDLAKSWGNQFYILDIIKSFAASGRPGNLIVLDSDCVWNLSASTIDNEINKYGCLTYTLDESAYAPLETINGVSRGQMKLALLNWAPNSSPRLSAYGVDYHGGEIFAATAQECRRIASQIDSLWKWQSINREQPGFLEEAHFLSILYAHNEYDPFTANKFIKRMWTTFKYSNLNPSDLQLAIWHLPSEKKSGFGTLFDCIVSENLARNSDELRKQLSSFMGVPRRSPRKFIHDLGLKASDLMMRRLRSASR